LFKKSVVSFQFLPPPRRNSVPPLGVATHIFGTDALINYKRYKNPKVQAYGGKDNIAALPHDGRFIPQYQPNLQKFPTHLGVTSKNKEFAKLKLPPIGCNVNHVPVVQFSNVI
jgi:hypothetical protein